LSRNRSAAVARGALLSRRQKVSRRTGVVDSERWGCVEIEQGLVFELDRRDEGFDVGARMASVDAALLLYERSAERSAVLVKVRHWRLGMVFDLDEEQGVGDWTFSWHRRKRNSDADGAGKP
jgi:hypothetical protein